MGMQWFRDFGTPEWRRSLVGWLSFSLATHLICSYFSVGYHSIDEQFQILEFLSFKLGRVPTADLSMEFFEQLRSWVQPAFYYGVVRALEWFGVESPFVWSWVFRLFSALVGWMSLVAMGICSFVWFKNSRAQSFCLAAIGLLWFLPALHARPSSEGLGGSFFVIGLCLTYLITLPKGTLPESWSLLRTDAWVSGVAGLLFGLSFECRFQMAVMIFGVLLWVLVFKKARISQLISCAVGFFTIFILGRWADAWGYGVWTFSPWFYFKYNILDGKVAGFGESPWWEIFRISLTESWPPLGLLMLISMLIAWLRHPRHVLTWAQVPFFVVHEWISHKELRFFFPLLSAGPVIVTLCLDSVDRVWLNFLRSTSSRLRWIFYGILGLIAIDYAIVFIVMIFAPATRTVLLFKILYEKRLNHPKMETVFTLDRDPYTVFGTPTYFYKPKDLEIHKISPDALAERIKKK